MFYYRFANWLNGGACTCAVMHGKYSSLDSTAVMNTNLSVGRGPWFFMPDPLKVARVLTRPPRRQSADTSALPCALCTDVIAAINVLARDKCLDAPTASGTVIH